MAKLIVIDIFVREGCERCHALLDALRRGDSRIALQIFDVETADGLARMAWRELVKIGQDKGLPVVWIRALGQAVAGEEALEAFGVRAIHELPLQDRPHPNPLPEGEGEIKGHVQRAPTEGEGNNAGAGVPQDQGDENVGAMQESPTGGCTDERCELR